MPKRRLTASGREAAPLQPGGGVYTPELAERILAEVRKGRTLYRICKEDAGMPGDSTVRGWAQDDVDGFAAKLDKARAVLADRWAEDIVEIADNESRDVIEIGDGDEKKLVLNNVAVSRDKLRSDNRKWLMGKWRPGVYGDKLAVGGDKESPLQIVIKRYGEEKSE